MGVGQVIKRLRSRKGISQEDLAEKAGVSAGNVSDIETKDRTPRLETLDKIAKVLETTSEAILKEAGAMPAEEPEEVTVLTSRIRELDERDRRIVQRLVDELLEAERRERKKKE